MVNSNSSRNRKHPDPAWRRDPQGMGGVIRVSLVIDTEKYPELAERLWSLPYGQVNPYVRDVLLEHVRGPSADAQTQTEAALQSLQSQMRDQGEMLSVLVGRVDALSRAIAAIPVVQAALPAGANPQPASEALSPAAMRFANTF